jgi:hypothetical protein
MQPFIAALHAMYDQAGSGPRMLWPDEAFAGVDGTNKASMFRLLTSCDLDWLIASPGIIANSAAVPVAAIVATVRRAIPDAKLWRFEARPPGLPWWFMRHS